jgi:hypothetical protein
MAEKLELGEEVLKYLENDTPRHRSALTRPA